MDPRLQAVMLVIGSGGVFGLFLALRQLAGLKRVHLFNVYSEVMKTFDSDDLRDARRFIYSVPVPEGTAAWVEGGDEFTTQRAHAERIARAFDQLALLVRQGRVPIDLIAHRYAVPVLHCWYKLAPYVHAVRVRREQRSHLWEWENLAVVIAEGIKQRKGIWHEVALHEMSLDNGIVDAVIDRSLYGPGSSASRGNAHWVIGEWWEVWRW